MSKGQIITFYSYKGGVGRSFILANVATQLALWGKRVLCVDWDLEAPGLHRYFEFKPPRRGRRRRGLTELISDFAIGKKPAWRNYLSKIAIPDNSFHLSLMSAGKQDNTYASRVQEIDWSALYEEKDLGAYLEEIRNDWKEEFDFTLIDSRTGITDIGGICTVQMPDILAFVFTANYQSLEGAVDVAQRAMQQRNTLPFDRPGLLAVPILSRLDIREERVLAEKWLKIVEEKVGSFYEAWAQTNVSVTDLITLTRIPYFAYWTFGERIAVLQERSKDSESISYNLQTLAALFAHQVSETGLLAENRDLYVSSARGLNGVESVADSRFSYDILLSYTDDTETFADKLSHYLNKEGLRVFMYASTIELSQNWQEHLLQGFQQSRNIGIIIGKRFDIWQLALARLFLTLVTQDRDQNRRTIPILAPGSSQVNIPSFISQFRSYDARRSTPEKVARQIVQSLKPDH
jgi:TIR domain/CobQ/CobB/MinD/ParA nucleotide binding domain